MARALDSGVWAVATGVVRPAGVARRDGVAAAAATLEDTWRVDAGVDTEVRSTEAADLDLGLEAREGGGAAESATLVLFLHAATRLLAASTPAWATRLLCSAREARSSLDAESLGGSEGARRARGPTSAARQSGVRTPAHAIERFLPGLAAAPLPGSTVAAALAPVAVLLRLEREAAPGS